MDSLVGAWLEVLDKSAFKSGTSRMEAGTGDYGLLMPCLFAVIAVEGKMGYELLIECLLDFIKEI